MVKFVQRGKESGMMAVEDYLADNTVPEDK
jgi:hypothetical protein